MIVLSAWTERQESATLASQANLYQVEGRLPEAAATPIITVIDKAFWDVAHAPKDQSNRRKRLPQDAVWEIHPVMALHVVQ